MQRREALQWISRGLQAVTASVVAIPGMQYILGGLHPSKAAAATHQRVARLQDLRPGQPLQTAVVGRKQDGWTLQDSQVVGRVWLVRKDSGAGQPPQVQAFTSLCPHMGCQIQLHAKGTNFVCPCHRAAFGLDGAPKQAEHSGERSHAPRGMDDLDCRVVQDEASGELWVEVKYEKFETGLTRKVTRV